MAQKPHFVRTQVEENALVYASAKITEEYSHASS